MASGGWNTIESDAGVFTFLLDSLGSRGVQFEELVSLDADSLQELAPVYGVIFLFKYPQSRNDDPAHESGSTAAAATAGAPLDGTYDHAAAENIFFAAQTIQNACGTQALLSVLLNKDHTDISTSSSSHDDHADGIEIGPQLRSFKEFTQSFPAEFRGEALSNSELIRDVHNSFAKASPFVDDSALANDPTAAGTSDDVYHFIAYTSIHDTLYELDGLQPAPIAHGPCSVAAFPQRVIPVLQRRIARYPATEIRFNLLAMIRDPRVRAREIGDVAVLRREEARRAEWQFENALRRHNFVGFAAEVLKGVVRQKVRTGGGGYESWVDEACAVTRRREEERRRGRGGKGVGGGDDGGDEEMVGM